MTKTLTFLLCIFVLIAKGQINPDCSASGMNSIYVLTQNNLIFRVDNVSTIPSLPVMIDSIPGTADGLTISRNLNTGSISPIFYSIIQNHYSYRDNSGWINTGHLSSTGAGNIGGGIGHIFNHRGTSGSIYSYDGNNNDAILVLFTSPTSVYDVATDSIDNFYVLVTDANLLYKFDSLGNPIDTFQVTGLPQNLIQPGLTLLGNTFYVVLGVPTQNALLRGIINGNIVSFTQIGILNVGSQIDDIAACPFQLNNSHVSELNLDHLFTISPNPTSFGLKITATNYSAKHAIQILNFTGQILYDNPNYTGEFIETRQLSNGIYFIKYSDTYSSSIKKFIVQH